jgi:hypothetical protein
MYYFPHSIATVPRQPTGAIVLPWLLLYLIYTKLSAWQQTLEKQGARHPEHEEERHANGL